MVVVVLVADLLTSSTGVANLFRKFERLGPLLLLVIQTSAPMILAPHVVRVRQTKRLVEALVRGMEWFGPSEMPLGLGVWVECKSSVSIVS